MIFCSNCGTQVQDTAKFCFRCGSPIYSGGQAAPEPQTVNPQPAYQQPAAPDTGYRSNHQECFGVNIVYPDGRHNEIGDLYITASELIFVKKSKGVRIAFGFVGSAIEQGEEKLRISFGEIAGGRRTRLGINPNVYEINLRNGQTYKLCVNNPGKISCLEQRFG